MTENIVPLRFNVEEVGKHVKASKKRFTWEVSLNSKQHVIVLDFSFISGKVKVTVDRKILLENQLPANTSFQYPFTLDGNALNVIQQGENFELRINNKVFSHLYNQMKTNKQFKKYEDQIKDFKVNQNQFQAKKLTLNIGGVGGGMKKKPKTDSAQQHNWNAFGGDQMSGFPSYFQGQSVAATASTQKVEEPMKKKAAQNLLDDSNSNFVQKQQKPQNILDFQAQVQQAPQVSIAQTQQTNQFSTMQMLFSTINMGNNQQQSKPSVVIDNRQVDFFSSNQQQSGTTLSHQQQSGQTDLYSGMNTGSNNVQFSSDSMHKMFATSVNTPNNGFSFDQGTAFNTMSNAKNNQGASGLLEGFTLNNPTTNLTTQANTQPQLVDSNNYNTIRDLFATNNQGGQTMNTTTINVTQQQTVTQQETVTQQQFPMQSSINPQHFATQQIPTQNFDTSFNLSPQNFGTQNFMAQGSKPINFLEQRQVSQQVPAAQQILNPQISLQPSQYQPSTQPNMEINNINTQDFNSIQLLFKTNTNTPQSFVPSPQIDKRPQSLTQNNGFTSPQQFATGNPVHSPNMMFMNTYSGNTSGNSQNFGFGFDTNSSPTSPQMFSTSANISMMKKQPASNITQNTQPANNNSGDLI